MNENWSVTARVFRMYLIILIIRLFDFIGEDDGHNYTVNCCGFTENNADKIVTFEF